LFKVGSIFIPVTDLGESMTWYEENLKVKKIEEWGEEGTEKGVGYDLPNSPTQLALVEVEKAQPTEFTIKENKRNVYFNFIVDDIEEVYQHFKDNGVTTTEIEEFGCMKCFEFYDLDGKTFSVVFEETSSPFHPDRVKRIQQ
jgi:glyoxylase I family protein